MVRGAGPNTSTGPEALRRAWRLGFHRARVERVTHSRVVVVGWRRGFLSRVVFANAYGCPRIG